MQLWMAGLQAVPNSPRPVPEADIDFVLVAHCLVLTYLGCVLRGKEQVHSFITLGIASADFLGGGLTWHHLF